MRRRTTPEEQQTIERFVKRHTGERERFGPQCRCRRKFGETPDRAMLAVLAEETDVRIPRSTALFWFTRLADAYGIERRRRPGPLPHSAESKKAVAAARFARWIEKKKRDPVAYKAWVQEQNRARKERRQAVK